MGPLGRPRRRWVDNIRMDLQEVGYGYVDWIGLAQDRNGWRTLVSAVMNLRVPWNVGNFLTSCKPVSCSGRTLYHGVSKLGRCCISQKTRRIAVTKADIADVFSEIVLFLILRTMTLVNTSSIFRNVPGIRWYNWQEFAGITYRECCC